jgi:glutathione S-transferase
MDLFYTSELSPFSARLRIAAAVLGVPTPPIVVPPGGAGSEAMRAIQPFGQVPVLLVGNAVLIESLALVEYLDEIAPANGLLPTDPVARARVRGIALAHDHHVVPAMRPLLLQLRTPTLSPAAITAAFDSVEHTLSMLVRLFDAEGLAVGGLVSLADVAIAPFAFLCDRLAARFDAASPYARVPRAASWWSAAMAVPAIAADTERRSSVFARMFSA